MSLKAFFIGVGAAIFPVLGVLIGVGLGLLNVWWYRFDLVRAALTVGGLGIVFGCFGFYIALRYLDERSDDGRT